MEMVVLQHVTAKLSSTGIHTLVPKEVNIHPYLEVSSDVRRKRALVFCTCCVCCVCCVLLLHDQGLSLSQRDLGSVAQR